MSLARRGARDDGPTLVLTVEGAREPTSFVERAGSTARGKRLDRLRLRETTEWALPCTTLADAADGHAAAPQEQFEAPKAFSVVGSLVFAMVCAASGVFAWVVRGARTGEARAARRFAPELRRFLAEGETPTFLHGSASPPPSKER